MAARTALAWLAPTSRRIRLCCAVVRDDRYARLERDHAAQLQPLRLTAFNEQALSLSEHDRKHHQPIFVDEVVTLQRVDQFAAAADEDRLTSRLFQLLNLVDDVARNDRG